MDFPFANGVAVITGAASGIGAALAQALARQGSALALADIDSVGLARVAADLRAGGASVSALALDIADAQAGAKLDAFVTGPVNLLVNNAGVALGGRFEDVSEADFDWLVSINFGAVVRLTRAFLPRLKRSPEARIVNISSVFGLVAPPGQTAYASAKFAVRGFSEALRAELRGGPVGVSVVHPGGVRTAIATNARRAPMPPDELEAMRKRWERALRMPPEEAARRIVEGVARRRDRILVGADARLLDVVQRLAPVGYAAVLRRLG